MIKGHRKTCSLRVNRDLSIHNGPAHVLHERCRGPVIAPVEGVLREERTIWVVAIGKRLTGCGQSIADQRDSALRALRLEAPMRVRLDDQMRNAVLIPFWLLLRSANTGHPG